MERRRTMVDSSFWLAICERVLADIEDWVDSTAIIVSVVEEPLEVARRVEFRVTRGMRKDFVDRF